MGETHGPAGLRRTTDANQEPASPVSRREALAFLREHDGVIFPQLARYLAGLRVPTDGISAICPPDDTCRFIWTKMSGEMAELIQTLHDDGEIDYVRTAAQTYMIAGIGDASVNAGLPEVGSWLPVLIRARRAGTTDIRPRR